MRKAFAWLILAGTILLGCAVPVPAPGNTVVSPAISGQVIDAKTLLPVEGVSVQVWAENESHSRPQTTTNSEGRFNLPVDKDFYLMSIHTPCPIYRFPPTKKESSRLLLKHPDYESKIVYAYSASGAQSEGEEIEMGQITIATKQ